MIALVSWTGSCNTTPDDLAGMLRLVIAAMEKPLARPMPASVRGRSRSCWETVAAAAEAQGGRLLGGWSVVDVEPRLPQRNPLARITLNAHAVLERDGVWYETIPERYEALGFIPGIVPTPNAYVEFFDDAKSVRKVELPTFNFDGQAFTHSTFELTFAD
jgi:hypothetical protein